jgi:hypothetical protein
VNEYDVLPEVRSGIPDNVPVVVLRLNPGGKDPPETLNV